MRNILAAAAASVCLLFSLSACSDSTGPLVDAHGALQSLSLAIGGVAAPGTPGASSLSASFDVMEPLLDHVTVTVDGKSRTMYGLAVRETFPAGTCEENLIIYPDFPPVPGDCTPMTLGTQIILWESHAANRPPESLVFIAADEGSTTFSLDGTDPLLSSSLALFIDGQTNSGGQTRFWLSTAGTLNTQTTSTGQSCSIPLPPYAKSGTCQFAAFDEQGAITFELVTESGTSAAQRTIAVPRQTLHGIWEQITETQPFTVPPLGAIRGLSRQPVRAPLLSLLDKYRIQARR
jgi:hypothetical protein